MIMHKYLGGISTWQRNLKLVKLQNLVYKKAMAIRNEVFIELIAQVLHEQLVIERPILHERMENLVELS